MIKYENGNQNFYKDGKIVYSHKNDISGLTIKLKGKELDEYLETCSIAFGNTMLDVNGAKNSEVYKRAYNNLKERN